MSSVIVTGNFLPALVLQSGLSSSPPEPVPDDTTPDAFTFTDASNVATGSTVTSAPITVAGLGAGISAPVTISGGTYAKNGGAYTSTAGSAVNGDTFTVRHTAAGSGSTGASTTLTIGGVSDTFTSTTAAPAIDPVTLFSAGEKGFIFDPSYAATVFSDTGATTQAVGDGTIAALRDRSPGALLATQATAGSRPTLMADAGGRRFVRSTGAKFMSASGLNLTGSSAFTATVAVFTATFNDGFIFSHAAAQPFVGGLGLHGGQEEPGRPAGSMGDDVAGGYRFISAPFYRKRKERVITVEFDPSGATDADRFKMWVDGQLASTTTWLTSGTPGAAVFANRALGLFGQADGGVPGSYDFFFLAGINRKLTTGERTQLESYARSRFTVTPSYSNQTFRRSSPVKLTPTYAAASPYATNDFDTAATSVTLSYQMPLYATSAPFARIGVWVDGTYYSQQLASAESGTMTLALPAGNKRVSLVNPGAQYQGVSADQPYFITRSGSITEVEFNAAATRVTDPTTGGLVIYGDSILMGQGSDNYMSLSWGMQVRAAYAAQNATMEGAGALALAYDATGVGELDALADKLASTNPAKVLLTIGTNDYGLAPWDATAFQAGYAALLDKLHARLPSAQIICLTPLKRVTEGANGAGSTLAQYRSAVSAAAAGRAYCTVIDGSGIILTGDLIDDVHPNQAGHDKVAAAIKTALGI